MTNIGNFEVLGPLGEGGMAMVYKARDKDLDRIVAIKQLAEHLRDDPQALSAFQREAKILARLAHPNVVRIYSVLEEGGRWYLVMEYVDGETLASLIRKGPVPQQTAVNILQGVLNGLDAMHRDGIVHRDLKPSNILLDRDQTARISDFGIAQLTEDDARPMDFYSVKYMAPEMYKPGTSDPRSDIYALGIIAYEMLLGEKSFRAECHSIYPTEAEIRKNEKATKWMNWHLRMEAKFKPLSEVDSSIPAGLSRLVERMTAKDLTRRYQDVGAVMTDLKSWQDLSRPEAPPETPEDEDATLRAPEAVREAFKREAVPRSVRTDPGGGRSNTKLYIVGGISVLAFVIIILALPPRNRPVQLRLVSVPRAQYILDEGPVAAAGDDGVLVKAVPAGKHRFRITAPGYELYDETVEVPKKPEWELRADLRKIPPPAPPKEPQLPAGIDTPSGKMVLVGAGEFIFGSAGRKASLPAFYIDETEVTNFAYRKFCDQTGHKSPPEPPWDPHYFDKPLYPVVNVSWNDAMDFAKWAGKRLPTELEWEKAARGVDGRAWPWGSVFDAARANLGGDKDGFLYTSPVGSFPAGRSPYGALDMAGNVWEWVSDAYDPATGRSVELRSQKVLKGGAFLPEIGADLSRTWVSGKRGQAEQPSGVGFRCARDAPALKSP